MPSDSIGPLVNYLNHQRHVVDYLFIAAIAVRIYDYLLTLLDEIKLIWYSPCSYTKALFLCVRYLPLSLIFLELRTQILPNSDKETCTQVMPVLVWVYMVFIICANVTLAIRAWEIWHRDRKVALSLVILVVQALITSCVCNSLWIKHLQFSEPMYIGFRGCYTLTLPAIMEGDWITLTIFATGILVLMCISVYKAFKTGDMDWFMNVIVRDGIMSYVYLILVMISNVVCVLTFVDVFQVMMVPLLVSMYSVLTCRIIMNIRLQGLEVRRRRTTELHIEYEEGISTTFPMSIRRDVDVEEAVSTDR